MVGTHVGGTGAAVATGVGAGGAATRTARLGDSGIRVLGSRIEEGTGLESHQGGDESVGDLHFGW